MAEALKTEKENRLRNRLVQMRLMEKAQQSIAEYPAVVQGKKRTKEMEGFNECLSLVATNRKRAEQWWGNLTSANKELLAELVLNDQINIEIQDRELNLWVDVSNIFTPNVDTETIHLSDLPKLHQSMTKWSDAGVYAFVSWKRQAHPHDKTFEKRYPDFREALNDLSA